MTPLVDSSAWIEYLKYTGSISDEAVNARVESSSPMATCSPVVMEVLAGAVDDEHADGLLLMLGSARSIPVDAVHYEDAAAIYRLCRQEGFTIRSMVDCLIAAVAIAHNLEVLHHDRDFNSIAQVVPLRIHRASLPA